mgnify:CR=1 FL=1
MHIDLKLASNFPVELYSSETLLSAYFCLTSCSFGQVEMHIQMPHVATALHLPLIIYYFGEIEMKLVNNQGCKKI